MFGFPLRMFWLDYRKQLVGWASVFPISSHLSSVLVYPKSDNSQSIQLSNNTTCKESVNQGKPVFKLEQMVSQVGCKGPCSPVGNSDLSSSEIDAFAQRGSINHGRVNTAFSGCSLIGTI